MANIKSQKKRNKTNEVSRQRNTAITSRMRTFIKKAEQALQSGDAAAIKTSVKEAVSQIDRAASKGVIHLKSAARKKSSLERRTNPKQPAS